MKQGALRWCGATAGLVFVADQTSKAIAVAALDHRVTVVPGLLHLTLLRNPGAALGTGAGYTAVLTGAAVVIVGVLIWQSRRLADGVWAWAFGLMLGGALGNLTDRFVRPPAPLRGHVVDFIDYAGFFVGNVADVALTVAAALMLLQSFRGVGLEGRAHE